MLRTAKVFHLLATKKKPDTVFLDTHRARRAPLYPIGTQRPHRSRMFYFRTAAVRKPTSQADCEFVMRSRRLTPMTHVASTSTWTAVADPTDVWSADTNSTDTWTVETAVSDTWST